MDHDRTLSTRSSESYERSISLATVSCCIAAAIIASSWAAYLAGKRHGRSGSDICNVESRLFETPEKDSRGDNHSCKSCTESASLLTTEQHQCPASSTTSLSNPHHLPPLSIHPIGTLHSIYRLCVGTPRQGMLVPHSRGILTFDETFLSRDSVLELEQYSHVYVVFVFHLNSNAHKWNSYQSNDRREGNSTTTTTGSILSSSARQFPSKIAPPSLGGKKVGIFSTRTPHRPNPIGFSLCKLDKVVVNSSQAKRRNNNQHNNCGNKEGCDTNNNTNKTTTTFSLLLSGLDIVDGTPILDVKPYVPHYDCVGYKENGIIVTTHKEGDGMNINSLSSTSCNAKTTTTLTTTTTFTKTTTTTTTNGGKEGEEDEEEQEEQQGKQLLVNDNSIVRVPQWVDSGLQKRRSVTFLPAAEQFLIDLAATPSSSSSTTSIISDPSSSTLWSKLQFYGPNSPWMDASSTVAVQILRNVIIEIFTADVRSVWQTTKARRGKFQAERCSRLVTTKMPPIAMNETKRSIAIPSGGGGVLLHHEGDEGGGERGENEEKEQQSMIEYCTQQIDNLLVHYTMEGPKPTYATLHSVVATDNSSSNSCRRSRSSNNSGSNGIMSAVDERSMGSGAEDSVVIASISFL